MLAQGDRLSGFRLVERIGARHKGDVWRALDVQSGREVALRVLPFGGDAPRLRRCREDTEALVALAHPNIAAPVTLGESAGLHFAVTAFIRGSSLAERIPSGGLSPPPFFALALPLAAAISAAHERRVVHGDLKPRNILVSADGTLKVLDFGLRELHASDIDANTDPADAPTQTLTQDRPIGPRTLPYCSPERVQWKPLDHRADVYSLGAVLYEMATGQRPFAAESPADLIVAILRDPPRPIPELNPAMPSGLDRVIARAMAKDRGHRLQAARFLHEDLSRISGNGAPGGGA